MPLTGRRHLLIFYPLIVDRWWKMILASGLLLLIIAGGLGELPVLFPNMGFMWVEDWRLWTIAGAGMISTLFSIFLITVRKKAYVQAFPDHFRIITPFLRLNVSYRRVRRSFTSELQQLFPPSKLSRWKREMIRPLAKRNVVLIEMASLPIQRGTLRLFLSSFFFPDQTAKFCLLVPDWLAFSTELDSCFSSWQDSQRQVPGHPYSSTTQSRR